MAIKIYNTIHREKEEFIPIKEKNVNMYVCGPTVYDYFHIGNGRTFIVFDTVRKYFEYRGYNVNFVQNFTDIDDKLIKKANEENLTLKEIGDKYINAYYEDADALNITRATVNPRVTEYVDDIINFVKDLVDNGYAYVIDGDVYYDTLKFKEYGKLSKQNLEDLQAGARIGVDERKKNPMDFVLWKGKKEGEPGWNSPWGEGRPGWHIECSCMADKLLGHTIDIHAGGADLVFPHHENEIAQSEGRNGVPFANYWMHAAFINVENQKMSKSLNNFFTAREVLGEYSVDVIRLFMLSAHYRTQLNFSRELMESAKASLERIQNSLIKLDEFIKNNSVQSITENESELFKDFEKYREKYIEEMDDDFNTANGISVIFDLIKEVNISVNEECSKELAEKSRDLIKELLSPLGIFTNKKEDILESDIEKLIEERQNARKNKDFKRSDEIRDELLEKGIVLEDTRQGVRWKKA